MSDFIALVEGTKKKPTNKKTLPWLHILVILHGYYYYL